MKIEYLFTSLPYRGHVYEDLGDPPLRVAEYLMSHTIAMANTASASFAVRNLFLQLAAERLDAYYTTYGFTRVMGTDLMFQALPIS